MTFNGYCLDTSVLIKYLCLDEQTEAATELVSQSLNSRMILPCFAWSEIASVLRKKIRSQLLSSVEAQQLYEAFCDLPIEYMDGKTIRARSWIIAEQYGLLTLYDAVFLAVAEAEFAQYWTADSALIKALTPKPFYVFEL